MIKKVLFSIILSCGSLLIVNRTFAQESSLPHIGTDFEQAAKQAGIDLSDIKIMSTISRYDITRILNAVECKDCISPGNDFLEKYTEQFWHDFSQLPGKDFDDIQYQWWRYHDRSYYYCVASVADNEYMYWYPLLSSPKCAGRFCGQNNMNKAEFIQVIINILAQYIAKDYTTNWKDIQIRKDSIKKWWYADTIISLQDKTRIDTEAQQCTTKNCPITDSNSFHIYLKYCMFNLTACNMKKIGYMWVGYRPIAELNIAIDQWLIINDDTLVSTIHKPIDWNYAISVLGRVFPKISCVFNNDYDCDGILNPQDNCQNTYNPNQDDTDWDKQGDVCDDDIDWDGIKNPRYIVDANGNINATLLTSTWDNCIFKKNQQQEDRNNNNLWDMCDLSDISGVAITSVIIGSGTNRKIVSTAIYSWSYQDLERTITYEWEEKWFQGRTILSPVTQQWWLYLISVKNKKAPQVYATQSISIPKVTQYWTAKISVSTSKTYLPLILSAKTIDYSWLWKSVTRSLQGSNKESKSTTVDEQVQFLIRKKWSYTLTAVITQWSETIAIAEQSFIIEDIQTTIPQISNKSIIRLWVPVILEVKNDFRLWSIDRWDGSKKETLIGSRIQHNYTTPWPKVIRLSISTDEETVTDTQTILVQDATSSQILNSSFMTNTIPNTLHLLTLHTGEWSSSTPMSTIQTALYTDGIKYSVNSQDTPFLLYTNPGIYYPQHIFIKDICEKAYNQATLIVEDSNLSYCVATKNWVQKLQCDFDDDGIDDRCDDDIDWDGIKNLLGMIMYNQAWCVRDKNNIKTSIREEHFQWSCRLDNCPLTINSDQADKNRDGRWDICEEWLYNNITSTNNEDLGWNKIETSDKDHDGISDTNDICPDIQEIYNGIEDTDWCPELWEENQCTSAVAGEHYVGIEDCQQCPCQYLTEWADLQWWDCVRATLRNMSGTIIQSRSDDRYL